MNSWPADWAARVNGSTCAMCRNNRSDEDEFGIRVHRGIVSESTLQRADVQRGYSLVIWTKSHVVEPSDLGKDEAAQYWHEVMHTARGLIKLYKPLKMNYLTLGNNTPHLHTHLIPRYREDLSAGEPFPLQANASNIPSIPSPVLAAQAQILKRILM